MSSASQYSRWFQVATAPGFVMRSPECLAVVSPRPVLIRHFVLLICKSQARTHRDPDTPLQACNKWTLTPEIPARSIKFPAPSKKFHARLVGNFAHLYT